MLSESWSIWSPLAPFHERIYLESIEKTSHIITLTVVPENPLSLTLDPAFANKKIHLIFQEPIFFFSCIEELGWMDDIAKIRTQYGDEFQIKSTFFTVKNSRLLQMIQEESEGTTPITSLTHFSIIEIKNRIDIITTQPPTIKWIQNNAK